MVGAKKGRLLGVFNVGGKDLEGRISKRAKDASKAH